MPTRLHGFVQALIAAWFVQHMTDWKVAPETEVRTRVSATGFRLPDVSVTPFAINAPAFGKTQDEPPLIAIEILSEDDRFSDLQARARALSTMGVRHIWLIDPEQRTAAVWNENGAWAPAPKLIVPETPVHLDLNWLWSQVDARLRTV